MTGGSVDEFDDAAEIIREQFDQVFQGLGTIITAVASTGSEATKELRDAILFMTGEAFDQVAQGASEVCDYIPTPFDRGLVLREEGEGCPECFDIALAFDERWVCEECETVWAGIPQSGRANG